MSTYRTLEIENFNGAMLYRPSGQDSEIEQCTDAILQSNKLSYATETPAISRSLDAKNLDGLPVDFVLSMDYALPIRSDGQRNQHGVELAQRKLHERLARIENFTVDHSKGKTLQKVEELHRESRQVNDEISNESGTILEMLITIAYVVIVSIMLMLTLN